MIEEQRKALRRRTMWSHVHQALDLWQPTANDGNEKDADQNRGPELQCSIPLLRNIIQIVENQETLYHGAAEISY